MQIVSNTYCDGPSNITSVFICETILLHLSRWYCSFKLFFHSAPVWMAFQLPTMLHGLLKSFSSSSALETNQRIVSSKMRLRQENAYVKHVLLNAIAFLTQRTEFNNLHYLLLILNEFNAAIFRTKSINIYSSK